MHPSLTRPRFVHRTSNLIAPLRNVKLEEEKELLSFKTLKRADKEEENASLSEEGGRGGVGGGGGICYLVSRCFEPGLPQRNTSGLKTNLSLSPFTFSQQVVQPQVCLSLSFRMSVAKPRLTLGIRIFRHRSGVKCLCAISAGTINSSYFNPCCRLTQKWYSVQWHWVFQWLVKFCLKYAIVDNQLCQVYTYSLIFVFSW